MYSQKVAQQSLRRRMCGPNVLTPLVDLLLISLLFVAVAVQQPYAMQWSMANAASPAAIALGKNLQTRLVGCGSDLLSTVGPDSPPRFCDRAHAISDVMCQGVPIRTSTSYFLFGDSSTD